MDEQAQNPPTSGCLRAVFATAKAEASLTKEEKHTHIPSLVCANLHSLSLSLSLSLSFGN